MTAKLYGFDRSFLHDTTERDPFVIDMVRAEDYLKLEAQVAALREQVRALAAENAALRTFHMHSPYAEEYINPLPTTDSALREIRAQAVDSFSEDCREKTESRIFWMDASSAAEEYAARIRSGEQS